MNFSGNILEGGKRIIKKKFVNTDITNKFGMPFDKNHGQKGRPLNSLGSSKSF